MLLAGRRGRRLFPRARGTEQGALVSYRGINTQDILHMLNAPLMVMQQNDEGGGPMVREDV